MSTFLFIVLAIIALSSFARGYLFGFKERYKKWHERLFKITARPSSWGMSRQTNHDRYVLAHWAQLVAVTMFLVISLLCLDSITIPLWAYFLILATTATLPDIIGWLYGKVRCDKVVHKKCMECGVDIPML